MAMHFRCTESSRDLRIGKGAKSYAELKPALFALDEIIRWQIESWLFNVGIAKKRIILHKDAVESMVSEASLNKQAAVPEFPSEDEKASSQYG